MIENLTYEQAGLIAMVICMACLALSFMRPIEAVSNAFYIARIYRDAGLSLSKRHGVLIRFAFFVLK